MRAVSSRKFPRGRENPIGGAPRKNLEETNSVAFLVLRFCVFFFLRCLLKNSLRCLLKNSLRCLLKNSLRRLLNFLRCPGFFCDDWLFLRYIFALCFLLCVFCLAFLFFALCFFILRCVFAVRFCGAFLLALRCCIAFLRLFSALSFQKK